MINNIFKTPAWAPVATLILVVLVALHSNAFAARITTFESEKIRMIVEDYIEAQMPWPQGTVRMEFPAKLSDIAIEGEKITYQVQSRRPDRYIGECVYVIRFYSKGEFVKEYAVRAIIEVLCDVVVSEKTLVKGSAVNSGDVRIEKKWLRQIPVEIFSDVRDVVGKRLRNSVRPNAEMTRNMLGEMPLVKKGEMVRIMLDNGQMQIMSVGLSEEDGVMDALIRVKNVSSKKMIYARVAGESLVTVEF